MTWPQVDRARRCRERDRRAHAHARGPEGTHPTRQRRRRQVCNDRQNLIARGYDPVSFAYPDGWADDAGRVDRARLRLHARRGGSAGSCRRAGARPAARRGPSRCPPEDPLLVRTPAFGSGEITLSAIQNVITQAELVGRRLGADRLPRRVRDGDCGEGWVQAEHADGADGLARRSRPRHGGRTMRAAMGQDAARHVAPDARPGQRESLGLVRAFSSTEARRSSAARCGAWPPCQALSPDEGRTVGGHRPPRDATPARDMDCRRPPDTRTSGPSGTVGRRGLVRVHGHPQASSAGSMRALACSSPQAVLGARPRPHTFSVRAKDAAGIVDPVAGHAHVDR